MRDVGLIDTTLRDGQQSLWATRMTTDMMIPILPVLDDIGYHSIEYMSTVQMDACVRYLGEDPWDRMRVVRKHVRKTPLRLLGMSQFFSISTVLPDDVVELFTKTCARIGFDHQWITASMNDVRTCEVPIRASQEAGSRTEGGVQYTISPVHTDDFFVSVTRRLRALGVDAIVLKDAGGLLTPERARTLLPAIVAAADGLPVYCHSHCVTGMGPASNLEAIEGGASAIWTSSTPLANGSSLPADRSMTEHLRWMGYRVDVDTDGMAKVADHFREVARLHDKPLGLPAEYDPRYYAHQMPGGMISNFRAHLAELDMGHRMDEVLEEMPRVRAELGYPNVQTPYSQFIATQALMNVLYGRYERVPDEIRRFVLGYWGKPPGPVDPDVLDKVGQGREPITDRPGEVVPPLVEKVRREQGPFDSDEDLLLAIFFMPETLAQMRQMQGMQPTGGSLMGARSVVDLVREVARSPEVRSFSFQDRSG
ncbi:MAG: pyruvate carboxylase subunit B, partial [Candidatus Velamenicoccus archaeovorus]